MKKGLLVIVALIVVVFVAKQLITSVNQSPQKQQQSSERNVQATDFTLPTLAGDELSLSSLHGKVVVLNFWASWCAPCQSEMPQLQTYYDKHKTNVEIVAVNVTKKDQLEDVKKFVKDNVLTFPILLDETGDISTMYGAFTLPTTIIIDRDGNVQHEVLGPLTKELLNEYVQPLL